MYVIDFVRLCKLYGLTDAEVPKPHSPADTDEQDTQSKQQTERYVSGWKVGHRVTWFSPVSPKPVSPKPDSPKRQP